MSQPRRATAAERPQRNPQTSLYVVAYDVPDDKRRNKIHKTLKGFGSWTEYSLFECFLTKKQTLMLRAKLEKHISR